MAKGSVRPWAVSYLPVTSRCSSRTTSETAGSTPVHRSTSHWISLTQDMKNVPKSRKPTKSGVRSSIDCSCARRSTSVPSGPLRPRVKPAADAGTLASAVRSYSPLSMRMSSFWPWHVIHRSRRRVRSRASSPGFIASIAVHVRHSGGYVAEHTISRSAPRYIPCAHSGAMRRRYALKPSGPTALTLSALATAPAKLSRPRACSSPSPRARCPSAPPHTCSIMRRAVVACALPVAIASAPYLAASVRTAAAPRSGSASLSGTPPLLVKISVSLVSPAAPAAPARHVRTTSKTRLVTPPPTPSCTATAIAFAISSPSRRPAAAS